MESLLTDATATERKRLPKATAVSELTGLRSWELKRGITIRERLNGSGSISFRLEIPAKVAGTRRIVQFKEYDDAEREAERALKNKEQFGRTGFLLSKAQMDDALRAIGLLSDESAPPHLPRLRAARHGIRTDAKQRVAREQFVHVFIRVRLRPIRREGGYVSRRSNGVLSIDDLGNTLLVQFGPGEFSHGTPPYLPASVTLGLWDAF